MTPGTAKLLIVGAASAAIAAPVWLLRDGDRAFSPPSLPSAPVRPAVAPPLEAALERRLFAEPDGSGALALEEGPDPGAPQLVGIVGRLPDRAVALVRTLKGGTRGIAIGESFAGWRLQAMSADAAFFTRDDERIRVALPPAETAAQRRSNRGP
jgi:hypothetical protein